VTRKSARSVTVNPNVRASRVYPTPDSTRLGPSLKSVGIKLTRDQALHLARVLLAVTQDWDEIDITAYRLERRKSDGTHQVTVTSARR
jgi:hypothetical protein